MTKDASTCVHGLPGQARQWQRSGGHVFAIPLPRHPGIRV